MTSVALALGAEVKSTWKDLKQGARLDGIMECRLESWDRATVVRNIHDGQVVHVEKVRQYSNCDGKFGWDTHSIWVSDGVHTCALEPEPCPVQAHVNF